MKEKQNITQDNQKESQTKIDHKAKEDFLVFLNKNKKDLSTGFGAFHTDNHANW